MKNSPLLVEERERETGQTPNERLLCEEAMRQKNLLSENGHVSCIFFRVDRLLFGCLVAIQRELGRGRITRGRWQRTERMKAMQTVRCLQK